ncbi:OadG family protein [Coprothermobacter platensis]|uniref:OadG family protein n=1 Tax=Coprothermobacter platensis TaxID=108819 RepID=UPI0003816CD6|nr:OadG family protein [Coprothermobacter platensis]
MSGKLLDTLVLTVVGLCVVFLVLSIDALVTYLLRGRRSNSSEEKKDVVEKNANINSRELEETPAVEVNSTDAIEPEIVAAITAALHYHIMRMQKTGYGVIRRTDVRRGL